jgi:hypothetical protein
LVLNNKDRKNNNDGKEAQVSSVHNIMLEYTQFNGYVNRFCRKIAESAQYCLLLSKHVRQCTETGKYHPPKTLPFSYL